jgi:hypothetical protein
VPGQPVSSSLKSELGEHEIQSAADIRLRHLS